MGDQVVDVFDDFDRLRGEHHSWGDRVDMSEVNYFIQDNELLSPLNEDIISLCFLQLFLHLCQLFILFLDDRLQGLDLIP